MTGSATKQSISAHQDWIASLSLAMTISMPSPIGGRAAALEGRRPGPIHPSRLALLAPQDEVESQTAWARRIPCPSPAYACSNNRAGRSCLKVLDNFSNAFGQRLLSVRKFTKSYLSGLLAHLAALCYCNALVNSLITCKGIKNSAANLFACHSPLSNGRSLVALNRPKSDLSFAAPGCMTRCPSSWASVIRLRPSPLRAS
jgi:hypothetical protein